LGTCISQTERSISRQRSPLLIAQITQLKLLTSLTQFKKLLTPGKIGQTLCLGNLTDKPTYEYLRSISPDLKIVKGKFDSEATSLPLSQVVTHGSLRIGFLEGFSMVAPMETDLMLAEANKLDVDVLCWGGTHRFDAYEYENKFFVNPGSATGAFSSGWIGEGEEMVPSFCLMDVSFVDTLFLSCVLGRCLKGL
jgi:vacuolar protein sorting-associated protein 29